MNAYQWKQEAFGAAVDRGLYNLASQIEETNTADFSGGIPWYIIRAIADEQQRLTPSKSPPERSGTTGHNQTLTRAQKCAIIVKKAIRRHVRRWKRKQEGKTMQNNFTLSGGCTVELVSLGRDDGAEIIGRDPAGKIACYIATENATQDRAAIVQAIKDGAQTLEQVFDMWENGLGGSPFDMEYLPEDYK